MPETPPAISVALCTYNGAAYLGEQLASIARQTLPPAEVIICDDLSTDDCVTVAREFANHAPFPVQVDVNERNLGVAANFGRGIGLCQGEIIALSDQDDVWYDDKLETLAKALTDRPGAALVFSDADLVDQNLAPLGKRLSDTGHIGPAERAALAAPAHSFPYLLRRNVATGATMALRRSLVDIVLPIPEDLLTYHDAWIVQIAAALGPVAFVDRPLMQYRQHPGQHTWDFVYVHGAKRTLGQDYYRKQLAQLIAMRDRLTGPGGLASTDAAVAHLDGNVDHLRRRASLPPSRAARLGPVITEMLTGRYARYSSGIRSALRDIVGPVE